MKSVTQWLIMTLAGLFTLLTVGKVFMGTKIWVSDMVQGDYGDVWIPVGLGLWFVIVLLLLFFGSAYLLKQLERVLSGKIARRIGVR